MSSFNYKNYVTRYKYQPLCWPPDIGLAELHARCSQPGPINEDGVQCPCCKQSSKKKVVRWWNRYINDDLKQYGSAIPGYFQLFKYYGVITFLVAIINSIYLTYATFYACENYDPQHETCLRVWFIYYLEFSDLLDLLNSYGKEGMTDVLVILQTTSFYILLGTNYFSIIYITFLNSSAKRQFQQLKISQTSRCLLFYNIPKKVAENLQDLLKNQEQKSINIIRKFDLYQIKTYYQTYIKRNRLFYCLQSLYVRAQNPLLMSKLNSQLQQLHSKVEIQKLHFNSFSERLIVIFENVEECKLIHSMYRVSLIEKLWIGIQALLHEFGIGRFDHTSIRFCTFQLGVGSETIWQNVGQQLGRKMSIRIKTFFIALLFLILCYAVLYYPILFSLKTHIKTYINKFVKLNTFQKILPILTSLALVGLSIFFRVYMQKISQQRNPKDHLQKSRFVLITCLSFHTLFYIIIPTVFFMVPGQINDTVRLYVISEQARTYIIVQVIIVLVDFPYRVWENKKISALSDQRIAFRNNQQMLHKIVECRDFPLQIRLLVLFRLWALVLLYSFFIPYIIFYIIVAFFIIFWVEKYNLYKHYSVKRRVSIKLQSDTLRYFVNFFCLYLCLVYCFTVRKSFIKIIVAASITLIGLIANVSYWSILCKGQKRSQQQILNSSSLSKEMTLLKLQKLNEKVQIYHQSYKKFLQSIQNNKLDQQIEQYLKNFREFQFKSGKRIRSTANIQMSQINKQEQQQEKHIQSDNQRDLYHAQIQNQTIELI